VLLELLLRVVDVLIGLVLEVNDLLSGLIRLLGSFSFLNHAVDIVVGKTAAGANCDLLLLTSRFILGTDVHDTIGINVESDLDLRDATGSHGDSLEVEIAKLLVVLGELALTLEDGDADLGLVVGGGREDLSLLGGNGRVSVDESGEDSTHGLDTEGKGCNIEQEDILDVTGKNGSLNSSAYSDGLIGVDTTVGQLVEEVLNGFTDLGDTAGAADHEDFINLVLGQTGVLEAGLEGF